MKRRRQKKMLGDTRPELNYDWSATGMARNVQPFPVEMRVMLKPRLRRCLNPIVFPDILKRDGLTLASLLAMPNQELLGFVPDFKGLRVGDIVTVMLRHRETKKVVEAGTLTIVESAFPLTFRFSRSVLAQFGVNGRIDFFYEVRAEYGKLTVRSDPTGLMVVLHHIPGRITAPVVYTAVDGVMRVEETAQGLVVDIPASRPSCKGGDRVRMRLGDAWFDTLVLTDLEAMLEPMLKLLIRREDILRLAASEGAARFCLELAYDIEREGSVSASGSVIVPFDVGSLPEVEPEAEPSIN
ncbi:hypothetical protein FIV34_09160 [Luteibacter pinisoli]|uniref:Uncharacterized protein n=1 Tax=Luteibacter pinisoli TaxID=2589080 RepID=A0A4Y5Z208_9GAMM|nr:hypothetical protein [Luteibacter pinisoli]QDE39360.1 hypothetical protein FIV34_09160 [Luteibacter pinisoli]